MMAFLSEQLLAGGLHFTVDGFRIAYALIAVWMWVLTGLFSPEYFRHEPEHLKRYGVFTILTFLATEGVMFSADLMTTFFFFEMLSLTSFVWVIHEETSEAIRAAKTYFFIAVIGGLVLFMGLALLYRTTGTLLYADLHDAIQATEHPGTILAAAICILLGFGAKAGMFPLHIWLPKSHPVAPSPASALLSGILTKVGIFGILMTAVPGILGHSILSLRFGFLILTAGTITMALGAVLALFSVNLKRTLACSSMSQIGFILVGIGTLLLVSTLTATGHLSHEAEHLTEETMELAHSGLALHMVNHSLIKTTLFMAAGVFVMNLHTLDLNDLRGYGRKKPLLMIPFLLGALGISGVPLFNGYISKTLLHEGLVIAREAFHECGHTALSSASLNPHFLASYLHVIEWIFLVSGGLTFAYMLKLFLCVFVEKNPERQEAHDAAKPAMQPLTSAVLLISSLVLPFLGQSAICGPLSEAMTGEHTFAHFHAFTWTNLKGGLISLGIGLCVYLVIVRNLLMKKDAADASGIKRYVDRWPKKIDLEDRVYRPVLLNVLPAIGGTFAAFFANNTLSAPLARGIFALGRGIATFFSVSFDGIILLLRATVLRERKRASEVARHGKLYRRRKLTEYSAYPLAGGFSFALMMACIGILLILGVILLYYLLK